MRVRGLGMVQLVALFAILAAGCTTRTEDTSCPAMESALDEALASGTAEPLPQVAEGNGYSISLVGVRLQECDPTYRFEITGLPADWSPSENETTTVCGPGSATGKSHRQEPGAWVMEASMSQWQPTGDAVVSVGRFCGELELTFTHVGRITQP